MSWNAYVDSLKMPDEKGIVAVEEAALCGILPGKEGVWASSEGLASITEDEIKKLAGDRKDFGQCGPCIAGVKCRMIRDSMDDETLHSLDLKTASDNEGNTYNICVGKSESGKNTLPERH
ncbi:profilin-1 [Xiphias gladius]|uniref:profilin-1 n=1 Tax=Xiphias gladius TaxID=8245 RepID=UPI001A9990BD|nr:profilin-1 [Xiphias gladius]